MNEEEKEAIKYLKSRLYGNEGCKYIDVAQEDLKIFINLIDSLQKENEKLIYARNWYFEHTVGKICTPEMLRKILRHDYISKQKIEAKIEELDIEISACEYADDDSEEYKQEIEKNKAELLMAKKVLHQLLESEEKE